MKKESTQSSLDLEELAEQSERDQNTWYKIPKELIRNKYMIRGRKTNDSEKWLLNICFSKGLVYFILETANLLLFNLNSESYYNPLV